GEEDRGAARDRHPLSGVSVAPERQQVLLGAEPESVSVAHPALLDHLELPRDAGLMAHEDESAGLPVRFCGVLRRRAVRHAAPDDAMALREPPLPPERVPWVGPPDVSPERAPQSLVVVLVAEV